MKYWIKGKYRQLLELLGIKIPDEWLLFKAVTKECGQEVADTCLVVSILLEIENKTWNTKKCCKRICEVTENLNENNIPKP